MRSPRHFIYILLIYVNFNNMCVANKSFIHSFISVHSFGGLLAKFSQAFRYKPGKQVVQMKYLNDFCDFIKSW